MTFEEDMGDFRKKKFLQTDLQGKNSGQGNTWQKKIPMCTEKIISFIANAGKNSYTIVCQEIKFCHQSFGKNKILTQTKPPIPLPLQKSHGQPLFKVHLEFFE